MILQECACCPRELSGWQDVCCWHFLDFTTHVAQPAAEQQQSQQRAVVAGNQQTTAAAVVEQEEQLRSLAAASSRVAVAAV